MNAIITSIVDFLRSIGLRVEYGKVPSRSFAVGVAIVRGGLVVSPRASPSCLLHEAGHLAITPTRYRGWMTGNLDLGSIERMIADYTARRAQFALDDSDLLYRAVVSCSDPEASAWAWAAGKHLGIHEEDVIRDSDYDGGGASVRLGLRIRRYPGINGLRFAGMCERRGAGSYPTMLKWLQDA